MVEKKVKKNLKKRKKNKREGKIERELLWIVVFIGISVIIFLIASIYFKSLNQVEYEGLVFTKKIFGEIPVYHYSYFFRSPTGNLIQYNLYVRNDPTTNDIPIEGKIDFRGTTMYVTLDTAYDFDKLTNCPYSLVSMGDLTQFLVDNQFNVQSGNMDFVEAAVNDQEYVTCKNKPNMNVIQIRRGDETKILADEQCVDIIIGPDCKLLESIEKFKVHAYLGAQER